jgi:hypothetical protein
MMPFLKGDKSALLPAKAVTIPGRLKKNSLAETYTGERIDEEHKPEHIH